MDRGEWGGNLPICPPELANIAFVWFALPRRLQALKSQGIVDDYHRYVPINFYGGSSRWDGARASWWTGENEVEIGRFALRSLLTLLLFGSRSLVVCSHWNRRGLWTTTTGMCPSNLMAAAAVETEPEQVDGRGRMRWKFANLPSGAC